MDWPIQCRRGASTAWALCAWGSCHSRRWLSGSADCGFGRCHRAVVLRPHGRRYETSRYACSGVWCSWMIRRSTPGTPSRHTSRWLTSSRRSGGGADVLALQRDV